MKPSRLILLATFAARLAVAANDFAIVDKPHHKGVILSAAAAARDRSLTNGYQGFWTPSHEQIDRAEMKIAAFLDASSEKHAPRQRKKLHWFRRQYVGYTRAGEKRIFCNFLPGVAEGQDPFEGLTQSFLQWRDRGPDYWQTHYRVEKDECGGFHVDLGY